MDCFVEAQYAYDWKETDTDVNTDNRMHVPPKLFCSTPEWIHFLSSVLGVPKQVCSHATANPYMPVPQAFVLREVYESKSEVPERNSILKVFSWINRNLAYREMAMKWLQKSGLRKPLTFTVLTRRNFHSHHLTWVWNKNPATTLRVHILDTETPTRWNAVTVIDSDVLYCNNCRRAPSQYWRRVTPKWNLNLRSFSYNRRGFQFKEAGDHRQTGIELNSEALRAFKHEVISTTSALLDYLQTEVALCNPSIRVNTDVMAASTVSLMHMCTFWTCTDKWNGSTKRRRVQCSEVRSSAHGVR